MGKIGTNNHYASSVENKNNSKNAPSSTAHLVKGGKKKRAGLWLNERGGWEEAFGKHEALRDKRLRREGRIEKVGEGGGQLSFLDPHWGRNDLEIGVGWERS